MPRIVMSLIPDENGRDGPFASQIDVSSEVGNLNDIAILFGNFVRSFNPNFSEARVYPKGSGLYYSSEKVGVSKEGEEIAPASTSEARILN